MATLSERVNLFITTRGDATCDRCIQQHLGLARPNEVQQITSAIATTSEFVREEGICAACGKVRIVCRPASERLTENDTHSDYADVMDLVHGAVESAAGKPLDALGSDTRDWLWKVEAALKDVLRL